MPQFAWAFANESAVMRGNSQSQNSHYDAALKYTQERKNSSLSLSASFARPTQQLLVGVMDVQEFQRRYTYPKLLRNHVRCRSVI